MIALLDNLVTAQPSFTAINSAAELQIMTDFRCLLLDRQIVARLQSFNTYPQY